MVPFELRSARLVLDAPVEADIVVRQHAPQGWGTGTEYTWAIRAAGTPELLGMIGLRTARPDIGCRLGEPHRGRGYMTEAVRTVTDWALRSGWNRVEWECVAGNTDSAAVARRAGFAYTGEGPSVLTFRDGPHSWHGVLPQPPGPPIPWPVP